MNNKLKIIKIINIIAMITLFPLKIVEFIAIGLIGESEALLNRIMTLEKVPFLEEILNSIGNNIIGIFGEGNEALAILLIFPIAALFIFGYYIIEIMVYLAIMIVSIISIVLINKKSDTLYKISITMIVAIITIKVTFGLIIGISAYISIITGLVATLSACMAVIALATNATIIEYGQMQTGGNR